MYVDVELVGDLTRGMTVVDSRAQPANEANIRLAVDVDVSAVREHIFQTLRRVSDNENAF
jgi:inosine-uridine nucleoside N-ribohydrolase